MPNHAAPLLRHHPLEGAPPPKLSLNIRSHGGPDPWIGEGRIASATTPVPKREGTLAPVTRGRKSEVAHGRKVFGLMFRLSKRSYSPKE